MQLGLKGQINMLSYVTKQVHRLELDCARPLTFIICGGQESNNVGGKAITLEGRALKHSVFTGKTYVASIDKVLTCLYCKVVTRVA